MRKLLSLILSLLIVAGIVCVGIKPVEAKEGFDIEKHAVEMEVHEDGSILVTETLTVKFRSQLHGIYFDIPKKYSMRWDMNGDIIRKNYTFPVTHVKVLSNQNKDITHYSNYVRIKLGSANVYKYPGDVETYKVQYEIMTKDLELNGLQMLFMNITSGKWNTDTHRVEFSIQMPKAFDRNKLQFDSPAGVTSTSTGPFNVVVTGNTISGSYNETLEPGDAITVQLMLGNDYFTFKDSNHYRVIGVLIAGALTLLMTVLFYIFGKDEPLVETVEFHAPAGLTSAEIGVIIDGAANDGDVVSLILDWGRRGLITITDDKEKGLILERKADLETGHRDYEEIMYNKLFEKGDTVKVDSLKNKFYRTVQRTEERLDKYFRDKERRLFTETSEALQIFYALLSALPIVIVTFIVHYHYYYEMGLTLLLCGVEVVSMILLSSLLIYMENRKYIHKWYTKTLLFIVCGVLFAIPCMILIYIVGVLKANPIYVIIAALLNILVLVETVYMKKRTPYCTDVLGQVLGLRNFIIVAEEDRLKELVSENPYYFYDILPFAYALGLTNVWNEHFRNLTIEPCEWYHTYEVNSPYYMNSSLHNHMQTMERTMTTPPPSESSSGGYSFGGGGGGGGGFSGGGFGGSSGGGW